MPPGRFARFQTRTTNSHDSQLARTQIGVVAGGVNPPILINHPSSSTIDPPGPAKVFFKAKEVRASSFVYINKGIMRD